MFWIIIALVLGFFFQLFLSFLHLCLWVLLDIIQVTEKVVETHLQHGLHEFLQIKIEKKYNLNIKFSCTLPINAQKLNSYLSLPRNSLFCQKSTGWVCLGVNNRNFKGIVNTITVIKLSILTIVLSMCEKAKVRRLFHSVCYSHWFWNFNLPTFILFYYQKYYTFKRQRLTQDSYFLKFVL